MRIQNRGRLAVERSQGQSSRRGFLRLAAGAAVVVSLVGSVGFARQKEENGPRNVVVLHADQLRADCLKCYGNPIVRTENIDRLASEGTRFSRAFTPHPQCVPSRSAMLTGRYPHVNGAISNYTAMSSNETTVPEYLLAEGYRTVALGKLHIYPALSTPLYPEKEKRGFSDTILSTGQHSGATTPDCMGSDYKDWCKDHGYWDDLTKAYASRAEPAYRRNYQAHVSSMPLEAYVDNWVGDRAVEVIGSHPKDKPLFMFVGFPNPHNPFEPPEPFASMYDPDEMPLPGNFEEDLSGKPPQHLGYKRKGRTYDYEKLDASRLRRVIAYYYASISLVDAQVGKVIQALRERELLEDTLVLFVADHGEFLGHHGMLLKSIDAYPMLYDDLIHVPLIIRMPGGNPGTVVEELVELIDVCPTVLEWTGLKTPPEVQGESLLPACSGGSVPSRDYVFAESGAVKALRGERYKLVYYPGQPYGELYDLRNDPLEVENLYGSAEHEKIRVGMLQAMLDRLIHTEAPRHGESMRGRAYWRTQYAAPFRE